MVLWHQFDADFVKAFAVCILKRVGVRASGTWGKGENRSFMDWAVAQRGLGERKTTPGKYA